MWLIIPAVSFYFFAAVSGAFGFLGSVFWGVSVGAVFIAGMLFSNSFQKFILVVLAASFLTLFGNVHWFAHSAGFAAALGVNHYAFRQFVKHHAPFPDAGLVVAGIFTWLLVSASIQQLGWFMGIFYIPVSAPYVLNEIIAAAGSGALMLLLFIGMSRYSKYGVMMK